MVLLLLLGCLTCARYCFGQARSGLRWVGRGSPAPFRPLPFFPAMNIKEKMVRTLNDYFCLLLQLARWYTKYLQVPCFAKGLSLSRPHKTLSPLARVVTPASHADGEAACPAFSGAHCPPAAAPPGSRAGQVRRPRCRLRRRDGIVVQLRMPGARNKAPCLGPR